MKLRAGLAASRRRNDASRAARDEDDCRPVVSDPLGNQEAVDVRQLHVEQHDLGAELSGGRDRGGSVGSLADDVEAGRLEQRAGCGPESGVVVDDERPSGPRARTLADGCRRPHQGAP